MKGIETICQKFFGHVKLAQICPGIIKAAIKAAIKVGLGVVAAIKAVPGAVALVASQTGFERWVRRYALVADSGEQRVRIDLAPVRRSMRAEQKESPAQQPVEAQEPQGDLYDELD